MFKNVRLKLALVNTVVLLIFLLVLLGIVYFYMNRVTIGETDQRLLLAAGRVENLSEIPSPHRYRPEDGPKPEGPPEEGHKEPMQLTYILRDKDLTVTAVSLDSSGAAEVAREAAWEAFSESRPSSVTVELEGEKMRLYSAPFKKNGQQGVVQVMQSLEVERSFLAHLMSLLVVLSLAGFPPALAAGWYLAGRSLVPVRKAWQQQQDFVSDASHELRTPLTVVQTNLEVALGDTGPDSENRVWLNNALAETKRMGRLINDLLLLAEADARQVMVINGLFDLSEAAGETAAQMQIVIQGAGLTFEQTITPGLVIVGDEQRIRQLLIILLDNAQKYTPAGGRIKLEISRRPGKAEIAVSDTGIGIAESEKERIFERFYRVDKARSRSQGGSGLGLAIAAWIVSMHKGKIKVDTQPGRGSRFVVELPMEE